MSDPTDFTVKVRGGRDLIISKPEDGFEVTAGSRAALPHQLPNLGKCRRLGPEHTRSPSATQSELDTKRSTRLSLWLANTAMQKGRNL